MNSFMKLFEKALYKHIFAFFSKRIDTNQHGFFKGRSITSSLTMLTQNVASSIGKGNDVHCVFTDFSKAFDRVNNAILMKK